MDPRIAVVETHEFAAASRKLFSEAERDALVDFLSLNPKAGDLIPGSGGVRKVRFALGGRGKSGGSRVIYYWHSAAYYWHSAAVPLFLLTAYAKGDRGDLPRDKVNRMRSLVKAIADEHRESRRVRGRRRR